MIKNKFAVELGRLGGSAGSPLQKKAARKNGKGGGRPVLDLLGKRFGKLVVVKFIGIPIRHSAWLCVCDCGKKVEKTAVHLTKTRVPCCGCSKKSSNSLTHGHASGGKTSPTYNSWNGMILRCTNPTSNRYRIYGGRGIKVCDRWRQSFKNFLEDMGERPPGMSLDRINNDGNYEPGNCRWATIFEQAKNKRPFKHENQWTKKRQIT